MTVHKCVYLFIYLFHLVVDLLFLSDTYVCNELS